MCKSRFKKGPVVQHFLSDMYTVPGKISNKCTSLYFRTVQVVILILFKPTNALFSKHIHIHIQNTKLLKMFVKHIIKTLHVSVTIV